MKNQAHPERNAQSGNIFFWIFLMIFLFAALSLALTQGFRGSSATVGKENARLLAQEVVDYANGYRTAIKALRIDGCKDIELNFETPLNTTYVNNSLAPATGCDVFDQRKNGVTYIAPEEEWTDETQSASEGYGQLIITGLTDVEGVGTTCANGDPCTELLLFVPFISKDVCIGIDNLLGVELDNGDPPQITGDIEAGRFDGVYSRDESLEDTAGRLAGKQSACFEGDQQFLNYGGPGQDLSSGAGTYHYYQVLLVR